MLTLDYFGPRKADIFDIFAIDCMHRFGLETKKGCSSFDLVFVISDWALQAIKHYTSSKLPWVYPRPKDLISKYRQFFALLQADGVQEYLFTKILSDRP